MHKYNHKFMLSLFKMIKMKIVIFKKIFFILLWIDKLL